MNEYTNYEATATNEELFDLREAWKNGAFEEDATPEDEGK